MPIFKNQNSAVNTLSDKCSSSAPTSSPICTLAGLSTDRRVALQEMIYICFRYKDELNFPNRDLYEKVLRHLVVIDANQIPVNDTNQTLFNTFIDPTPINVSNKLPKLKSTIIEEVEDAIDLNLTSVGYVSEACSIFALYYATKTLAYDVGFNVDFTKSIDFTPDSGGQYGDSDMFKLNRINNALGVDFASKSDIFTRLVDAIFRNDENKYLKKGRLNSSYFKKIVFKLLNPVEKYGFTRLFGEGMSKTEDFDYGDFQHERDPGGPSFLTDLFLACTNDGICKTKEEDKILKYNQGDLNYLISTKTKARGQRIFVNEIVVNLERQFSKVKEDIINEIATCLFSSLLPTIKNKPQTFFVAAGGGSGTYGLFSINNLGVLFFNYGIKYFVSDGSQLVPNEKNNLSNRTFVKNNFQTIHLSGYGNDFDNASHISINSVNGGLTLNFDHLKGPPNSIDLVSGTGITIVSVSPPPLQHYNSNTLKSLTGVEIGTFNKDNFKELRFNSGSPFEFNIEYTSGILGGSSIPQHDEVLLLFNLVTEKNDPPIQEPVEVIISLDDLYDNDKFEITTDKINRLFTSEEDKLKVEKIISFINAGAIINTPQLYGNFIGEKASASIGASSVIPNDNFKLNTYPGDGVINYEGIEDETNYEPLRYSFAKIIATSATVDIQVDSWVSPLRSRLDKRFNIDDFRTPIHYTEFTNLFPNSVPPTRFPDIFTQPDINLLANNYTLAPGTNVGSWSYFLYTDPTNASSTPIRSYNQVLAVLRSFGLLEAICFRIFDLSDADPSIGNKLNQLLINTNTLAQDRAASVRSLPTNKNLPNTINYSEYNMFKWYAIYYKIKGTSGIFQDTSDFDYDKYRHSF